MFKQKAVTSHPTNATSTRRPKEFADLVFQRITNSLLSYFLEAVNKLRLWAVGTVLSPESTVCPVCVSFSDRFAILPQRTRGLRRRRYKQNFCINDLALARCPVCWISRFYTSPMSLMHCDFKCPPETREVAWCCCPVATVMGTELKNKNKALGMNSIFLWYHRHVNHYQTFFSKQSSSRHFNMTRVFSHQPMGPGKIAWREA